MSLRTHRKGCEKSKGYIGDKRFKPVGEFELPDRPKLKHVGDPIQLTCYICGRFFGTYSLKLHIKQCEK